MGWDDILVESLQSKVLDHITRISSKTMEFLGLTCRDKCKLINCRTHTSHQREASSEIKQLGVRQDGPDFLLAGKSSSAISNSAERVCLFPRLQQLLPGFGIPLLSSTIERETWTEEWWRKTPGGVKPGKTPGGVSPGSSWPKEWELTFGIHGEGCVGRKLQENNANCEITHTARLSV